MRRRLIRRRRLIVLAGVLGAGTLLALLLLGGGEGANSPGAEGTLEGVDRKVRELVRSLETEEKVEQLILAPPKDDDRSPGTGGALLTEASWPGLGEAPELIEKLRGDEALPPLIATRQEGGPYRALADLPPEERPLKIGDAGSREQARSTAKSTAEALDEVGIDLNLAPVADVAALDSPIADRAFSDDPAVAAAMVAATVRGCEAGGTGCAPSHFPGMGGATQSTDLGPASVGADLATLQSRDLAPFRAALAAGAPAVLVGHAFYAAFDPVTPASLSPPILADLLRDELGFEGAAITDDLSAGAIQAGYATEEAAIAAVAAGADIVQLSDPAEIEPVRDGLLEAAESGELAAERLDRAVARVIELKRELGLID